MKLKQKITQGKHHKGILITFSDKTLALVVNSLAMTKKCHGVLFRQSDKAIYEIIKAIKKGKDKCLI